MDVQSKPQVALPFASMRDYSASHTSLRNHWNHIVVPQHLNKDTQKHTYSARKTNNSGSSRAGIEPILQHHGTTTKIPFLMRATWSLGVADHIKARNHNSGSIILSPYLPACVTSTACSVLFFAILSHTAASCSAISITQHLTDSWGCSGNIYTTVHITAYKIIWSFSKGKAPHKLKLLLSATG